MDFLKKFIKNVLPVKPIIKFIINKFLSSYVIYSEKDLEEKVQPETGLKNFLSINDLELNVPNINNKHLLHSPIKLLKGKFGKFDLDIDDDNKIIVNIEDVSLKLMPIFNFYKKYQETIFNMEEQKKQTKKEAEEENKKASGNQDPNQNTKNDNQSSNNSYMINLANKLLTNLEINIRNISVKLYTYEISEKIIENPVFTFFILNISIYKDEKGVKNNINLIDPNTKLPFEKSFLDNLVIDFDKLCLKLNINDKQKDLQDFAEIKNFCKNKKKLTKEQENKIINFFIDYNTIFALNYKNGPCLSIKLNMTPKIEKYKINETEKEKIVEDMNIEINIAEVESIVTPNQFFNIQIFSQISNFIFTLNKNTPNKFEENENKKVVYQSKSKEKIDKNEKDSDSDSTKDKDKDDKIENDDDLDEEKEKSKFSLMFDKSDNNEEEEKEDEDKNNLKNDNNKYEQSVNMSYIPKQEKVDIAKEEPKKTDVLNHEIEKFNIAINCKRVVVVALENKDNESIPKLFSFLMEDEIISKKKNLPQNKNEKIQIENIIFGDANSTFENYYCYFEDNLLLFKIDNIKSINTCINVSSILAEYIQPIDDTANINEKKEKKEEKSKVEMSIYESAGDGFSDLEEVGDNPQINDSEVFQSVLENTELLIMENYGRFINKFIAGEYKNTKFEILTINEVKFDMSQKLVELNEFFFNINYMIILLMIRLMSKVQYFMSMDGKKIQTIFEDFLDEAEENLNINLEKKINDTELQLFNNLKKKYDKNGDGSDDEGDDKDIFEESIGYSEEEKQKKEGMKIKVNYFSLKVNNIATDPNRFDGNIYYFNLFKDLVYPNLSRIVGAKLTSPQNQYFQDILSPDFIELILVDIDSIYYNINSKTNIHMVFKELLFKYWNETIMKYTNNNKNDLDTNPNIIVTMPGLDVLLNFEDKFKMNIDKNAIDNLLSFNFNFLYGLSMYQIYDKYCSELFNNKLINLFDLFGLKNHIKALKNIKTEEEKKEEEKNNINNNNKKINQDKKVIKEIEKQMNKKKPKMSVGGKFSCIVLNINKNKSFDLKEGNLVKMKMLNVSFSFEMFDTDDNNNNNTNNNNNNPNTPGQKKSNDNKNNTANMKSKNSIESVHIEKEEPIYNIISVSINNILFLVKEKYTSEDSKPKYYNLFSKNKSAKFDSTDYFFMTFKFRNVKKTNNELTIVEIEEDEESDDNIEREYDKKISKESDAKSKNSDKFKEKNVKIALDPQTKDYIAFLLNNQVKLDNMEMVIDVKIAQTIFNSFYDKLNDISSSLNNLFLDFTNSNANKEKKGPFFDPKDRIPLCEDRIMFIKVDFAMNDLLFDIFLKPDENNKKNWMRLLFSIEQFKFALNEKGMFVDLIKNNIFILKDFRYIINDEQKNVLEIDDKINDIHKEDSYIKRLGYVELFYNDGIKFIKTEKEMNVNLGNINLFFCKDSYNFLLDFMNIFNKNYLSKIKEITSSPKEEINFQDSDDEEIEKEDKINSKEIILEEKKEEKQAKKEKKEKNGFDDFEVIDDVFFIDDNKKIKDNQNKKIQKNYENLYLKKHPNKLETIEEYGKKSKKRKESNGSSGNMMDDFAIIETKSSLERNINRVQKEEDCITYILKLDSLHLYLFQGSDFNFEDSPKIDLTLETQNINENQEENDENNDYIFPDNSLNNEIFIDSNYLFKINEVKTKQISKNKRKRNDPRDYSNYIVLNLIEMEFKIVDFSFYDFSINKFFIDDNFENSQYQKIISKKDFLIENSKFLICKFDLSKNNAQPKEKEKNKEKEKEKTYIRINLSIPSLEIFIDQIPLLFLFKFFVSSNNDNNEINSELKETYDISEEKIEEKSEEKKSDKDKISNDLSLNKMESYDSWNEAVNNQDEKKITSSEDDKDDNGIILINEILINSFTINLNYNSHKISFYSAYIKGDWLELLSGLSDIKELTLKFKPFRKLTPAPISDSINELINFYKDEVLSIQATRSALRGLSITRPFLKLYDGVKDLVKQPYVYYKENKGIKRGIKKGMKNFLVSFSSTGIFFGEKIFRGIKIATFGKTTLSLKKKSLYKTWIYKVNKKQHDYETYYFKQK